MSDPVGPVWSGRDDGPGPQHLRWHQHVRLRELGGRPVPEVGVALIGFASDEGVRRNGGRPGAAHGPDALRRALASLAVHPGPGGEPIPIVDAGTVTVGTDLEAGQVALGDLVADCLDEGHTVVVLGGGHESAYGSYLGRNRSTRLAGAQVGVLNLDAHFDLREADRATSGTAFRQMADAEAAAGRQFRYTVLGIAEPSNTRALFDTARRLGVHYLLDTDCGPGNLAAVLGVVDDLLAGVDVVHLGVDLDVLPAAVAPGVSAPAGHGVDLAVVLEVCRRVAASGKLAVLDIAELCPPLDIDGRTARAAARLVWQVVAELDVPTVRIRPDSPA